MILQVVPWIGTSIYIYIELYWSILYCFFFMDIHEVKPITNYPHWAIPIRDDVSFDPWLMSGRIYYWIYTPHSNAFICCCFRRCCRCRCRGWDPKLGSSPQLVVDFLSTISKSFSITKGNKQVGSSARKRYNSSTLRTIIISSEESQGTMVKTSDIRNLTNNNIYFTLTVKNQCFSTWSMNHENKNLCSLLKVLR